PERDERFHELPGWGMPAARIAAAGAIMLLVRHATIIDDDLHALITQLSTDPVAPVRYQIASHLCYLYRTAPALMWDCFDQFAQHEENRGVLQGTLEALHRIANAQSARVAALAHKIFDRTLEGPGAQRVRQGSVDLFVGLIVWHRDPESTTVL